MAQIKDEGINIPQSNFIFVCGVLFADHGSMDRSTTCVMRIDSSTNHIIVEEIKVYEPFSKFAIERNKQIFSIQEDIFKRFPGVHFLKEQK